MSTSGPSPEIPTVPHVYRAVKIVGMDYEVWYAGHYFDHDRYFQALRRLQGMENERKGNAMEHLEQAVLDYLFSPDAETDTQKMDLLCNPDRETKNQRLVDKFEAMLTEKRDESRANRLNAELLTWEKGFVVQQRRRNSIEERSRSRASSKTETDTSPPTVQPHPWDIVEKRSRANSRTDSSPPNWDVEPSVENKMPGEYPE